MVTAGAVGLAWVALLGWDQDYDVAADGTVSGPYSPWQVAVLVLVLALVTVVAAVRGGALAAVLGVTAGVFVCTAVDWLPEGSTAAVGVMMATVGAAMTTLPVAVGAEAVYARRGRPPAT